MAQLSRTFPDLDPAFAGLHSKALEVERHSKIHLHCYSELEDVKGYVGNFDLVIREKATSVDGENAQDVVSVLRSVLWNMLQSLRGDGDAKSD